MRFINIVDVVSQLDMFLFSKIENDSENYADSKDIKIFIQFPVNSILKFLPNFWNCVGGTRMFENLKITGIQPSHIKIKALLNNLNRINLPSPHT